MDDISGMFWSKKWVGCYMENFRCDMEVYMCKWV